MNVAADATGLALLTGMAAIAREQLPTGEIPSYGRSASGGLLYHRSPLVSSFVHDTLGCFDPRSPDWEPASCEAVPEQLRGQFVWTVARVRRRIRAFLSWQAEPDATWRFFGRSSGIDPDANSTACAASALLEAGAADGAKRAERYTRALRRFRAADGRYFTFINMARGGYGWMDALGGPLVGFDQIVNAYVLHFLTMAGCTSSRELHALTRFVCDMAAADREGGVAASRLYTSPLAGYYAVARAEKHVEVRDRAKLVSDLIRRVLHLQHGSGGFGGPLMTALGAATLLELEYDGAPLANALDVIGDTRETGGGWAYEPFLVGGIGSPALSTALSITALARSYCRTGAVAA